MRECPGCPAHRDLSGDTAKNSGDRAELALSFWVRLGLGRSIEGLHKVTDQSFRAWPLPYGDAGSLGYTAHADGNPLVDLDRLDECRVGSSKSNESLTNAEIVYPCSGRDLLQQEVTGIGVIVEVLDDHLKNRKFSGGPRLVHSPSFVDGGLGRDAQRRKPHIVSEPAPRSPRWRRLLGLNAR
jgi:hypothetical protein